MAKNRVKKTPRPKAETAKGFRDYFGAEVTERRAMLDEICAVYHAYGFDPLETSGIETVEALGKFLPDVDRPNEGVFGWQDEDETWLALRYDLTAPLARVYAQHRNDLPNPYRRYAVGPVWRNEKPGPGRFRQFYQCDADTVGTPTVAADAEICMMLADAFGAVGIERDDVSIRVNNRKVLNGVMESIDLSPNVDLNDANNSLTETVAGALTAVTVNRLENVMRTIDKFDKVGEQGVRELLGNGRKDASGAFIPGVGLTDSEIEPVVAFLLARGETNAQTINNLKYAVGKSQVGLEGVAELEQMAELMDAQGYGARAVIDPSVVRGLGYYTGPVYEAELTFEITDEEGRRRQFGSVAGGGRYDDLVKRFTGQAVPATGISIGVDRLLAALTAKRAARTTPQGPVVILVMDRGQMAGYQTMCAELRTAGIRAEVFLGGGNMAKQLKYADRRAAPVAIIEGEDERRAGVVTLKDLALGARLAAEIETRAEWTEQPAQISVSRTDLVSGVRAVLSRASG